MKRVVSLLIVVLLGTVGLSEAARDEMRTERVHFPPGQTRTTIQGSISGYQSVSYLLGAEADQTMKVTLKPSNSATYFNVYEPGRGPGDQALANSGLTGQMVPDLNVFHAQLPTSGTYTISVYMVRAAARRNERSKYRLDISISALSATKPMPPVKNDYADGLQGGPDFWEVTGVSAGDFLNLREKPSTAGRIMARLRNGTLLRNLGCRMFEGQSWCKVEAVSNPVVSGWVANRFLREGAYPDEGTRKGISSGTSAGQPQRDALVPRTHFNATGVLPCARYAGQPTAPCRFGVVRTGGGNGTVTIFWPDGGSRMIFFEAGKPISYDASQADAGARLRVRTDADLFLIEIGHQRFEIPDAVISGG